MQDFTDRVHHLVRVRVLEDSLHRDDADSQQPRLRSDQFPMLEDYHTDQQDESNDTQVGVAFLAPTLDGERRGWRVVGAVGAGREKPPRCEIVVLMVAVHTLVEDRKWTCSSSLAELTGCHIGYWSLTPSDLQ